MGLISNCGQAMEIFSFRKVEMPQEQIERKSHSAAPHLPEVGGGRCAHHDVSAQ